MTRFFSRVFRRAKFPAIVIVGLVTLLLLWWFITPVFSQS
jgi:hypothetical protein